MNQADVVRTFLESELGASNVDVNIRSGNGFAGCEIHMNLPLDRIVNLGRQKDMEVGLSGGEVVFDPTEATAQCYHNCLANSIIRQFGLGEQVDPVQLNNLVERITTKGSNAGDIQQLRVITGATSDQATEMLRFIAINLAQTPTRTAILAHCGQCGEASSEVRYTAGDDQGRPCIWKKCKDGQVEFHKFAKTKKEADDEADYLNNPSNVRKGPPTAKQLHEQSKGGPFAGAAIGCKVGDELPEGVVTELHPEDGFAIVKDSKDNTNVVAI